ncbi:MULTISPECIES: N-acyl homoserine lactonase family protein [Niastella]|uniref:N-acyl homoserine lactonase family protein n=1 Tax=Niastella soli TaxID=2821487 RepID=A0ABS3YVY9_9BACT|nr:N-acyl homoserine lactonase family protein [Niastella soli]MBO9202096.1 N-acyl homoserine lactonase family protein [Niastella soli]
MKSVILFVLICLLASKSVWAQSKQYEVYALKFASSAHRWPIADWVDKGPKNDSVQIDFMIWLIKGNGRTVLVDAGFLNDIPDAKEFTIVNYVRPDSTLQKMGLKPTEITDIILSHPHWDHIDGLNLFPNAQVWMQQDDFYYYVGAAWQKGGSAGGFNKRDVRKLIDKNLAGKLTLVNGDSLEIIPGIKVFTGSRHTFNSQYVLVETGSNNVILASDNIWVYYSLEHMLPASAGGTYDPAGYVNAMQRMKTLVRDPRYIIPGHDGKIFSNFPAVKKGVVKIE